VSPRKNSDACKRANAAHWLQPPRDRYVRQPRKYDHGDVDRGRRKKARCHRRLGKLTRQLLVTAASRGAFLGIRPASRNQSQSDVNSSRFTLCPSPSKHLTCRRIHPRSSKDRTVASQKLKGITVSAVPCINSTGGGEDTPGGRRWGCGM